MFHSDKIVGKIKRSKKLFEGKEKSPWNKGTSKKKNTKNYFLQQRQEVLNRFNIGKSWFDHEGELWSLKSCSQNASGKKIVIPGEDNKIFKLK